MTESQPQQMPRIDKDAFLQRVRSSGLISRERLDKALSQVPKTDRGKTVARALVEQGLLTKFQAERLLAGKTDGFIMGQYRILDELGRGGMGHVFKAEHMTMGRIVAVKILNSSLLKTERARQLFHREVKAAAKLNHPNIVTAFDANQVGDRCFLVMEYVDGPNLYDLATKNGPLQITQACDYVRQTALGLQHAHDLGMVHRDIKPANLLVQKTTNKAGVSSSVVKVLDFGLARVGVTESGEEQDSIETNARTVMGTPDYLSPEQARSLHGVDGRADIYSLGCTFYFLLTQRIPYEGGTTMEKLVRHSTEHAVPVNTLRPEIPVEIAVIVQKMMAKKPDDRFQSAAELAQALLPYSGQETTSWVTVESLPVENIVPVSSQSLPRIPVSDANPDPFANLDSSSSHCDDAQMVGTLSGDGALTDDLSTPTTSRSSKYRRRKGKKDSGIWATIILFFVILAVGGGIAAMLRYVVFKGS